MDSRDEAARIVPAEFRPQARIVKLNRFTKEQIVARMAMLDD